MTPIGNLLAPVAPEGIETPDSLALQSEAGFSEALLDAQVEQSQENASEAEQKSEINVSGNAAIVSVPKVVVRNEGSTPVKQEAAVQSNKANVGRAQENDLGRDLLNARNESRIKTDVKAAGAAQAIEGKSALTQRRPQLPGLEPSTQTADSVSAMRAQPLKELVSLDHSALTQVPSEESGMDLQSVDGMELPEDLLAKLGLSVESVSPQAVRRTSTSQGIRQDPKKLQGDGISEANRPRKPMSTESFLDLRGASVVAGGRAHGAASALKEVAKESSVPAKSSLMPETFQPQLMLQGQSTLVAHTFESGHADGPVQLEPKFVAELGNAMSQIAAQPSRNGEIRIRLNPEHLGEVRLMVKAQGDQVSVRIDADNPEAKALFERSIQHLESGLAGHNLVLKNVEVGSLLGSSGGIARLETQEGFREPLRFDAQSRSQDQTATDQSGKQGGSAHERYNQRRAQLDERLDRIA
jgi:flagellar hook-length control protein FliK